MFGKISKVIAFCIAGAATVNAEIDLCKFNFGLSYEHQGRLKCNYAGCEKGDPSALDLPNGMDFLAMFAGFTQVGSTRYYPTPTSDKEGNHIKVCKAIEATPVWYGYIIAEGAKLKLGVEDCNNGGGLCTVGAKYIRDYRDSILTQYKRYASFAASNWGKTKPFYFLIEPDFYQYTEHSQQNPLSFSEANKMLTDIATSIKTIMPNAVIGMDISPWASAGWWSSGIPYAQFQFMGTSGGVAGSGGTIKDGFNWSTMFGHSKLGMMADDGYGVGGAIDAPDPGWLNESNLKARIADGVFAYWRATGDAAYGSSVASLRTSLASSKPKTCSEQSGFALTLSPGTGGTITTTPAGTSFPAGTSVQLTATPATGYRFVSWGGAASGTTNPTTVTMDAAKTVSATFAVKSAVKYTLTLNATTNGTISATPSGSIDSGATVTLVATPAVGYKLSAWSGDASGTARQTSLVMNANKTVGATFVVDNTPVTLTVGTATNGTVAISPVMPSGGYARGTAVTLTATPASGYQLVSWGAAVSGNTNPLALKMDSNISVAPVFRKIGEVSNLIKGGDGSSTTNWTVYSNPAGAQLTVAADPKSASNSVLSTKGNYGERSGDTAFMVSQSGIQLVAGTTYYLSFRAMVSSPDDSRGPHPMGVRVVSGASSVFKVSDSVLQDTSWHEYTYSFRANASGSATLGFLLGNAGDRNWQSVLIDDIVLSDLPPVSVGPRNIVRKVGLRMVGNTLDFSLATQAGRMRVDAIAPSGEVRNLADLPVGSGVFRTSVSVADLRSGIYTLRIRNGQQIHTGTFSVVK